MKRNALAGLLTAVSATLILLIIVLAASPGRSAAETTPGKTGAPETAQMPKPTQPGGTPAAAGSPTHAPAEATEEPADDPLTRQAREILSGMTTWEKVCQLFIVYPEDVGGEAAATQAGESMRTGLKETPVGGFIYASRNLKSGEQTLSMIADTQADSPIGLIIAADEEGGVVNRLMSTLGTTYFQSMYNYKDDGPDTAYRNAVTIAGDMAFYGFNTDFAPVADVWSNKQNTVIGKRAYSDDFSQAAELVAAAVRGFHAGGVACTLKHFPGHGDTSEDSHLGSAYVYKTEEQLMEQELLPFMSGIEAGADLVMIGHLTATAIDDKPATISRRIVTGLLRDKLGFDGVVITDGMEMEAITEHYTAAEAAVLAIEAGDDIILGPPSLQEASNGIMQALNTGELTTDRIDESVLRILKLKLQYGIIDA